MYSQLHTRKGVLLSVGLPVLVPRIHPPLFWVNVKTWVAGVVEVAQWLEH